LGVVWVERLEWGTGKEGERDGMGCEMGEGNEGHEEGELYQ
jgi:hypothetical protein